MLLTETAFRGRDPWVIKHNEYFYHCFITMTEDGRGAVGVSAAKKPEELISAEQFIVYIPEDNREYSKELWAPELHFLDGKCYIYVACDDGNNDNHRMYVLENGCDDPTVPFHMAGKLTDSTDRWAIDGTVFEWKGVRYTVWSGWEGSDNVSQKLYIAEMSDPLTISSERVMISEPEYEWEKLTADSPGIPYINEGPAAYIKGDTLRIFYSGSSSNWNNYCIAMLTLTGDDPMKRESWTKCSHPILSKADGINGPGHCSVFSDGETDYIAYHLFNEGHTVGWENVHAEIHPFELNDEKLILK